ncbi:MAG: HD domain-containing phosphohydrolase [Gemmatimonadota bacterium]
MSPAVRFLTALSQAISAMGLYRENHPSRERALDLVHERAQELQEKGVRQEFSFVEGHVVHNGRVLRELRTWEWGPRLAAAGIGRLELVGGVDRDDLDVFLDEACGRLAGAPPDTAVIRQVRESRIRYGAAALPGKGTTDGEAAASEPGEPDTDAPASSSLTFTLREEADAVEWMHSELKNGRRLDVVEAEAIIRSLSFAMHGEQQFLIPLLRLKQFDQYTTTHALNVSVLAMALAEFIELGPKDVRNFGIAGLLHDLGKTTIPEDILNKPGKLTAAERKVMQQHTVEGARIIIETEDNLDMAAIVAYEHHICLNGTGYPSLHHPRECHQCSNMVHVCDVYDALRTTRPYRDAWEHDRVMAYIRKGAGTEFEPGLAHAFLRMMERWESRVAVLENADEALPGTAPATAAPSGGAGSNPPT